MVRIPRPIFDALDHMRTHGIEHDIALQFEQVAIPLYQDTLVAALKHMAGTSVAAVVRLRVNAIQLAHASRQVGLGRFDHQVIGHLASGMDRPVEALATLSERGQLLRAIGVVVINVFTPIPTRSHVIQRTGRLKSQRTGHARSLAGAMLLQDLTCDP